MQATYTNGKVAFTKCLVFGLCVFTEDEKGIQEWVPFSSLDDEDKKMVRAAADWNPIFRPIMDEIYTD